MKGYYRHILLAMAAALVAMACTKTTPEEPQDQPMPIRISATDGLTKALLDSFEDDGNRIQVYSYLGGSYYFSDLIGPDVQGSALAETTDGVWPFVNGPHQWSSGTHKFFGWLTNDVNGSLTSESLFGSDFACVTGSDKNVNVAAFDKSTQILSIPVTSMTIDATATKQFDFMYSDIFTTEPINAPVQLKFSHLFAAYYFSFTNDSAEELKLESIRLNIKSKGSATLNYSGTAPVVDIAFTSDQPVIEKTYNTSIAAGKTIDVLLTGNEITSTVNIPNVNYRLIWPQDLADATVDIVFSAKVAIPYYKYDPTGGEYSVNGSEAITGGAYKEENGHFVYVGKGNGTHNVFFKYDTRGTYDEVIPAATEEEMSKSIPLAAVTKDGKWYGGEKYNYNLSFSNDFVDLKVVVMRWDGGHGGNITFE